MRLLFTIILTLSFSTPVWATTRHMATTGSDANSCAASTSIDTPKRTWASSKACMSPGDTLLIQPGTYNEAFNITGMSLGTDTTRYRIVGASTAPVFSAQLGTSSCRSIISSSTTKGLWIENIHFTGENICPLPNGQDWTGNRLDTVTNVTLKNVEISWFTAHSAYIINSTNVLIDGGTFHDHLTDCVPQFRYYAFYVHSNNTNIRIINTDLYNNPGGAIQVYPGGLNGGTIKSNRMYHNSICTTTPQGAITVATDSSSKGPITNLNITDNLIYKNREGSTSGSATGIKLAGNVSNVNIMNNTIYANTNNSVDGGGGYGIFFVGADGMTGIVIRNNIITANEGSPQVNLGNQTGVTVSHNACTAAENCGATNKVTITGIAECVIDATNNDYRLKQGTNPCRNVGTTVSTRPAPVGVSDVGAFEQGTIASAVVAGGYIEVTYNLMTPGALPASGITAFTITNGTSTGTPVVTAATVKPGSSNVILLETSGFTAPGTCTISYGAGNLTDSGFIGPPSAGMAQGPNSATALAVSGTCDNSAGGTPPATNIEIHYPLDEGTGTTATDAIGANDGTFVESFTWLSPKGVSWASGGAYAPLQIPYGNTIDPKTQGFTLCGTYAVAAGSSNVIIGGSSTIGTNQRFYFGSATGATLQLGVYDTSYVSVGESEFQLTATETRVCIGADAANDLAVLVVNGVKGTTAASSRSTASMGALAANLTVHCVINALYCGNGLTAKDIKVWSKFLTQQEFTDDYLSFQPVGASVGGYEQKTFGWEGIYTYNSSVVSRGTNGQTAKVVAGGGIALVFQLDCTGGACDPLAVQFYYATDCVTYDLPIPTTLGGAGIALWGDDTSSIYNKGEVECCLTGALTQTNGPTLITTATSPTIELAENTSYTIRVPLRFAADKANSSFCVKAKQDNGAELDTPATGAQIDVVPMSWSR